MYFTDVALQMDAKHLGDEYNRTDPPKKVGPAQLLQGFAYETGLLA